MQGADGVLLGKVFVIYDLGASRVNDFVVVCRGFRFVVIVVWLVRVGLGRVSRFVAVVITAATSGSNANGHEDCQGEVCQFHAVCTFNC